MIHGPSIKTTRPRETCTLGLGFVLGLLVASAPVSAAVEVPAAVRAAENARIAVMERVAPTVVAIFAAGGEGGGSGVLIDADGYCVTNFHVVMGQGPFLKCGLNDGNIYDSVLVGIDPTGDVAVIKLLGRTDFPFATLGDSDAVRAGDSSFAMGNPFLLANDFQPTVTAGMVSGVHRYQFPAGTFLEYTDCLQVDASINPGNSGGPLFNAQGEVIGINGRISVEKRGKLNVGAGYAISINQVLNFLDQLKSGRVVDHATLGATVSATAEGTVEIARIMENSEAYRRGLRRGDELVSFAGRPIRSVNQFKNILGIYPQGWTIPLSYRRDGQRHDIHVRLMALHRRSELLQGEDLDDRPPPPGPEPEKQKPHAGPKVQIPEQYKHLYEERRGYANYAFNAQHQQRLLKLFGDWGDYSGRPQGWAIVGTVNNSPAEFRLQPDALAAKVGSNLSLQNPAKELEDLPANTGGLLVAMEQFRHLLQDRDDYFTELYYLGSEPLDGSGERVDVLVTTKGLVRSCWYFRQQTGELLGFDTLLEEDRDPCQVRFSGIAKLDSLTFPTRWSIRHADQTWGELQIQRVQFYTPATGGASAP
ncbi:S1C family serine protease [Planctomicrobium sp. SH664]|uniref:S1C family serine protease n=1 Tax=Planctomicrobium sp. SH664 TaxID=3448125 RepID=UPI003F5AEB30